MREKIFISSLGCFRNTYDSGIIVQKFINNGYKLVPTPEGADIIIINTCGFIDRAKKESIEAIKEAESLKKRKKIKKIFVYGCLVKRYEPQLRKFFRRVDKFEDVVPWVNEIKRKNLFPSHIDFIKIADGCINNCSYCAIPLIKGSLKSKPLKTILKEIELIDKKNIKELNIIGQDITSWGKDIYKDKDVVYLIEKILEKTNIPWIRLLYTHPKNFSDELIRVIGENKNICKYIDLPIQHINDRILKIMRREITKKEILHLIDKIRKRIPGCAIRTSIIVGFPTETEKEFQELLNFIKKVQFERLGAFIYSREEGTYAYNLKPQIHHKTKERRYKEIMILQREISTSLQKKFIGKEIDVLIDKKEKDMYIGRTEFDAYDIDGTVFINNKNKNIKEGELVKVNIVDAYEYDLVGEIL